MTTGSLRDLIAQRGIFGCAALHWTHRPVLRHRLLAAAYDAGFRQFDVAPAYGNGLAERALGEVFAGVRDVQIHTKGGIPVTLYPRAFDHVFPLARAADMLVGKHRSAYATRCFDAETLARDVDGSIARLRGRVPHTLFLHDPLEALTADAWAAARSSLEVVAMRSGIATFGVAGVHAVESMYSACGGLALQVPFSRWCDPAQRAPVASSSCVSVFGLFAAYRASKDGRSFEAWLLDVAAEHDRIHLVLTTRSVDRLRGWGRA
jgi:hypothetical protein